MTTIGAFRLCSFGWRSTNAQLSTGAESIDQSVPAKRTGSLKVELTSDAELQPHVGIGKERAAAGAAPVKQHASIAVSTHAPRLATGSARLKRIFVSMYLDSRPTAGNLKVRDVVWSVVRTRPDILVLGAGGVLDEAWMGGVLAGIEDATGFDLRRCEFFVGTSAGSLVAARLAAGQRPDRPKATPAAAPPDASPATARAPGPRAVSDRAVRIVRSTGAWAFALGSPLASAALGLAEPGGAVARAAMLRVMAEPTDTPVRVRRALTRIEAAFDGRLRIAAVERRHGRRVVFGQPGSPIATVEQAVEASCAVPWMYTSVRIAGCDYVDGSVWSPTNLDVAPARRDTHVLCLNPIAGLAGPHPAMRLARETARARMLLESQSLRARGAHVRLLTPDADSVSALARSRRARDPRARALAAGYRQGLALAQA